MAVPAGAAERPPSRALYVSPAGNDAWSGTHPAPDRAKADGPFATLERARDEIRKWKAAGALKDGATVFVRAGDYDRPAPFRIAPEDSGAEGAPVVYRAYPGERPVLRAGTRVTGFTPHQGAILKADVAAQGLRGVSFRQLYYNGRRMPMARYPNVDPARPRTGGWAFVDGTAPSMYQNLTVEVTREILCRPADVRAWAHPEDGEVDIYPRSNWWNCFVPVTGFDREKRTILLGKEVPRGIRPLDRYYIRGIFEELDAPGEWHLDRRTGTLYFWPPGPMAGAVVHVPRAESVIEIEGASHVSVRGFTLECCEGSAISMRGAKSCLAAANTIRNIGGRCDSSAGVLIEGGSGCGAVGNDIFDVASYGIRLNGGDQRNLTPAGHVAENNYIHHVGVLNGHGCGVSVGGVGNRVAHNLIHDTARCGIFGGGNDNVIEFNRIRHVNLKTEDTGGIYVCAGQEGWMRRGCVIRHNFLSDVLGFGRKGDRWASPHYAWGIYLDDALCEATVVGNIVARAPLGGAHIHGGRDHVFENNIFVDGGDRQMTWSGAKPPNTLEPAMRNAYARYKDNPAYRTRYPRFAALNPETDGPMGGNRFVRNILCYRDPQARLYGLGNYLHDRNTCDSNLVWHDGLPLRVDIPGVPAEKQWEEWRNQGSDRNSLVSDPLFVNPARDDYRLRAGSPALKLGFQPIPVEKIGPYADPLRASWPIVEAPGEREHPFSREDLAPIPVPPKPASARPAPFPVPAATAPVALDGTLTAGEWPAAGIALKETPARTPVTGRACTAWLTHDRRHLYVALSVPITDKGKMRLGETWGDADAAEVCFQDGGSSASQTRGPIFVLRGFAAGRLASATEAGAPADAARRLGIATRFAARISEREWTAEWAIPLLEAGIAYVPGRRLGFNLGVRRSETAEWLVWVGAGSTWQLENAGTVLLE